MKKIALLSLLIIFATTAHAQFPENFNTKCVTNYEPGSGWVIYNPVVGTIPLGEWSCAPNKGRPATTSGSPTPGMQCTGTYSSMYNLDTAYLITPTLFLSSVDYPGGHVFLRFDSKRETIIHGGKLSFIKTIDTTIPSYTTLDTPYLSPIITADDSTDWVTHQIDLSSFINTGNFYLAFRYTSGTTFGTAWYIDNIVLTSSSLNVSDKQADKNTLPITIVGNSTRSQITLSYTTHTAGRYRIALYDMLGREVYTGNIEARTGTENYTINDLYLHPGMYCIKMGNETTYGTAKLVIE